MVSRAPRSEGTFQRPEGIVIFGYSIIGAIIVGLILGVLAKFVMPGKQAVPIWLTILVGIVAAIIGNYVATLLGVRETFGFDWIRHGLQLLFAVLGIGALAGVYARKSDGSAHRCRRIDGLRVRRRRLTCAG